MATRGSVTPASAAGRTPADLSVHVDTWSEYIAGSAASPAARYPAPQSPARVKHVGEGEVLFKLKTIHAAAHQAVAAARRRPEIRVGAVRKSDPGARVRCVWPCGRGLAQLLAGAGCSGVRVCTCACVRVRAWTSVWCIWLLVLGHRALWQWSRAHHA